MKPKHLYATLTLALATSGLTLLPQAEAIASPAPAGAVEAVEAAPVGQSISGIVSSKGKKTDEWVVFVHKGPSSVKRAQPKADVEFTITQKGAKFSPGVLVVPRGATVTFPNNDKFYHNVFSVQPGNAFDLGLYRKGTAKSATFDRPGEVDVYCNIHPQMKAKILVVPTEHVAIVADDGSYQLDGLGPGEYDLVAWSPRHAPIRSHVTLGEKSPSKLDFEFEARNDKGTHLRKDGTQYGRYE